MRNVIGKIPVEIVEDGLFTTVTEVTTGTEILDFDSTASFDSIVEKISKDNRFEIVSIGYIAERY